MNTEIVEVRDPQGRLILEYAAGRAVLYLGGAALTVAADDGAIEISSDREIRIRSAKGLALEAPELDARIERTRFEGGTIQARAGVVEVAWGRIEQTANRVILWSKSLYQRIESLFHTRAGRVRTDTAGAFQVQAGEARMRADGDVHVNGRTVHLG